MVAKVITSPQGPELSEVIQGYFRASSWGMSKNKRLDFIKQHLELGITSVDHADIYGDYECERLFGEALALDKSLRSRLQIITKCDIKLLTDKVPQRRVKYYDTSAEHIYQSVNNSLERLGVDDIDLLLIHRPDALLDADEVAEAFTELNKVGKVRHFGVSNFTPRQFELLQSRLGKMLATNQVEISPLQFDVTSDGTLDQLQQYRVRPMAWSCLGGGALFSDSNDPRVQRLQTELHQIKEEIGAGSIEEVIYAWVRRLPSHPLPIVGSGKIERVQRVVSALQFTLSREQWYRIWTAAKGHEVA